MICGTIRRLPNGDVVTCGNDATHVAVTPYGSKRTACADCAQQYVYAGFLVAPASEICDACLRVKPAQRYELRCWCGAAGKRRNVDGLWLVLCQAHQPPPLGELWKRLWLRVVAWLLRLFVRPKQLTAVEAMKLTERARNKRGGL